MGHWDGLYWHIILKRSKVDGSKHWYDDCIGPLLNPLLEDDRCFCGDDLRDQTDTYVYIGRKSDMTFDQYVTLVPGLADYIPDSYPDYLTEEIDYIGTPVTPSNPLNLSRIELLAITGPEGASGSTWRRTPDE